MAQDFGILITQPGVSTVGAPTNQVLMNTTNPFIKLDTQNSNAFQSLLLLLVNDPPEPVGPATHKYTTVAQFKHNYKYIPAVEMLFFVSNAGASTANTQLYFQDSGQLSAHSINDYAALYAVADATNVYLIIDKYNNGGSPNILTGTNIQITSHVFVEDLSL